MLVEGCGGGLLIGATSPPIDARSAALGFVGQTVSGCGRPLSLGRKLWRRRVSLACFYVKP